MNIRTLFLYIIYLMPCCLVAQVNTDSLLRVSQSSKDRDRWGALIQLGEQFKFNDPQRAQEYAGNALTIAEKLNDDAMLARSNQVYGGIVFRLGNFNKARECYQNAITGFSTTGNEKGKAETQNALATLYYAQGNIAQAVQNFLDVLRYYESRSDKSGLVNVYISLAGLYARQNSFSKSIEYNLKAIELFEASENKMRAISLYDQIGNAYWKQNNRAKAKEYFGKSLKAYQEMNNKAGVASTLNQLGNLAAEEDDLANATTYFRSSNRMAEEMKTPYLQVINLNALGKVYVLLKQYDKAVQCYKKAIQLAKLSNMKLELEDAYQGLASLYEETRQEDKASTFKSLSTNIRDSLYNDSTLKLLSDLQLRFESEKKERQIERLSKEKEFRESELDNERRVKQIFIGVSVMISILMLILIYSFIQNKRYSKSLQRQKNELEQRAKEITEQKEKVDQLNSVKDRFFSIISHDLRNNLTTMKLYFDLISNPAYQPTDLREISSQIAGSVENTIDLLENLLVWASAQIKGIPIHIQRLHIHTLVSENIGLLTGTAAQKNIQLINHVDDESMAYGDMDMINLVVRNLISNAIKFTPEQGVIELSSADDGDYCTIAVKDNGIGISAENQAKLFDSHLHPTTKGTGNEKGTGLGLLLCRDFISQNNGKIWVESTKGNGSTFYFSLPLEHEVRT